MGSRIFAPARVLVTCVASGLAPYTLGPAVPGFHTLSEEGWGAAESGRIVSYVALNAVVSAPTIEERGLATATLSGGVWTLTPTVIRRQMDGTQNKVSWSAGTIFIAVSLDPADTAIRDTDGFLGIGGAEGRAYDAPLDVRRKTGAGAGIIAGFGPDTGTWPLRIYTDRTEMDQPLKLVSPAAPTDAAHAARKDFVDAQILDRIRVGYGGWANSFDPGVVETNFFAITIPVRTRRIFTTTKMNALAGTGSDATLTLASYVMNAVGAQVEINGPAMSTPIRANWYGSAAEANVYEIAPAVTVTAPWSLQFRGFRNTPISVLRYAASCIFILDPA